MRKFTLALGLSAALVVGAASPALAASGTPHRPDGQVTPVAPSDNGGDNGWGNCGHNSSGGATPSGAKGHGNGGYSKGDCVATVPTDPTGPPPI